MRNLPLSSRLLLAIGFGIALLAAPDAHAQHLDRLAALLQGHYDTHPTGSAADAETSTRLRDSRQRAQAEELGEVVFYLQLNRGANLEVYRQRILVFAERQGRIELRAYVLKEPGRFVDATSGDDVLLQIGPDDVEPMFATGCLHVWTETDGGFAGYTDPATCRIISGRTGKPRRIEAETLLREDSLALAERGYDDDMNPLFGTPQGDRTVLWRIE